MPIIINIFITLATILLMEAITWVTHKYVMHGFLWYLHKDHHQPKYSNWFEKNDLFFVIFAIPSFLLIFSGIRQNFSELFFILWHMLFYRTRRYYSSTFQMVQKYKLEISESIKKRA